MRYVVLMTVIALCGCSTLNKWKENLFDQGTERREFQTRKMWVRQTTVNDNLQYRKINRFQPIAYGNFIIQANAIDGVVAFDRNSGQEVWRVPVLNGVEAPATTVNDRMFFGGMDGQFYSVSMKDGTVLWTFPTRIETLSEPLIQDGNVIFLTGNNSLYSLDASSGKQNWLYTKQDASSLSVRGGSKPAYANGTIYVGFSDGSVVALLSQSGAVKWEVQLSNNKRFRDVDSDPVIEKEFLYLSGFDDSFYCLRTSTGEVVWKQNKGGYGTPLVTGKVIYYAATSNELLALNKETGQINWSYKLKEGIATPPVFYKGIVAFGESSGPLHFVDGTSGKQVAFFNPGRGLLGKPLVDEKANQLFFISGEANLWALEIGWKYPNHIPYLQ